MAVTRCTRSPSWYTVSLWGTTPSPSRVRKATRASATSSISVRGRPIHDVVQRHLRQHDPAAGVGVLGHRALGEQPAEHLVGGPAHRGDRGDAEPLVDLGATGVVDAGDHVLDAEGLAGDPRGEDVGVVAVADGGEGVGGLDPGLGQGVAVEPDAGDTLSLEGRAEAAERRAVLVDDRDVMPLALETEGQGRADTAAAHDHEMHGADATRSDGGLRTPPWRALQLSRVNYFPHHQAGSPGPCHAQRQAGGDPPAQADRPPDLRQRRPVVRGLRP